MVSFAAGRDLFHRDGVNYTTVLLPVVRYLSNMPGSGDNTKHLRRGKETIKARIAREM